MSRFDGSWRVHEHVFAPDGVYRGRVVQKRRLEPRPDQRVRVIQDCEPDASLDGSPMARFRGHHEFDLVAAGCLRSYRGPAVLGSGLSLGTTAMLGRGVWPEFGHSFTSYSAMVGQRCQLTGGTFYLANRPVAVIVGQAVPADDGDALGDVSRPVWPGDIAQRWRGSCRRFDAAGADIGSEAVEREYVAGGFLDSDGARVALEPWAGGYRLVRGEGGHRQVGTAMRYGCALFVDLTGAQAGQQDWIELVDPARRVLISIRRVYNGQQLDRVELHELAVDQEAV